MSNILNLKSPARWIAPLLLFVLAIVPFLPAIHGDFTWDDNLWLQENPAVHAWNGLWTIWNPFIQSLHYYPLVFTTFWVEHKLWGLDSLGYHAVNMLLHACSTVVLWLALRRLGLKTAWLGALIWAIHPVQVETVAWVAERKNTLSGLFYFLAALAYLRFERVGDDVLAAGELPPPLPRRWSFYALTLLAFVAALLSKTVVCTLPAGLFFVLWWKRGKLRWHSIWPLLPILFLGLAVARLTAQQESSVITVGGGQDISLLPLQRLLIAGMDFWFYIRTLLFPYPLMAIYPKWNYDLAVAAHYLPIAALAVLLVLLLTFRRRLGFAPFAAIAFFITTISPALGFINFFTMLYSFVADHYQYLACAGLIIPAVEVAGTRLIKTDATPGQARRSLLAPARLCATVLVMILMSLSAFYAGIFRTNLAMWSWNVRNNPNAFIAQQNLAMAYLGEKDFANATKHMKIALAENPLDDTVLRGEGDICMDLGQYSDAAKYFQRAAELRPGLGLSYMLLGDAYLRLNQPQKALDAYKRACASDTLEGRYFFRYASLLALDKKFDRALAAYQQGLNIAPGNLAARYDYANLLLDLGRSGDAITQYQFILKYQTDNPLVWHNLAAAYYQAGKMPEALAAKDHANTLDQQRAAATQTERPTTFP